MRRGRIWPLVSVIRFSNKLSIFLGIDFLVRHLEESCRCQIWGSRAVACEGAGRR